MIDRDRYPIDPWRLVETSYSHDEVGVSETLFAVGNGYLGLRGNSPEGRFAHEHGTFINGFHEVFPIRHAEQAYGFAEVGQTIINAPDAKIMRVYSTSPMCVSTSVSSICATASCVGGSCG